MPTRYRSIFLSDFHIGAKKFAAPALLDFLRHHESDYLYLADDIIERSDVDGIICGHTHIPALKHFRDITYANCGSWLTGKPTAIIEKDNGSIELIDWNSQANEMDETFCEQSYAFRPATLRLMQLIKRVWPSPHEDRQSAPRPAFNPQPELS